eukprot:212974_1
MESSRSGPAPLYTLRGHGSHVRCVSFIGTDFIISGTGDGHVFIWNLKSRRCCHKWKAHSNQGILSVGSFSGTEIFTQGRDGLVKAWKAPSDQDIDYEMEQPIITINTQGYGFCLIDHTEQKSLEVSDATLESDFKRSNVLVACAGDPGSTVDVWKFYDAAKEVSIDLTALPKRGTVQCLKFAKSNKLHLLTGSEGGFIDLWDISNKTCVASIELTSLTPVLDLSITEECSSIFFVTASTSFGKCNLDLTNLTISIAKTGELQQEGSSSISVRHDSKIIALSSWDHSVRIFGAKKLKPLAILKAHDDKVSQVCMSPSSNLVATCSDDKTIAMFELY